MASILRMTEKLLMPTGVRLCRRLPQPHMRIPVPADAPPHGRDRLHIEAGDRIAPGYLRIQGILRLPGDITGEECVQDCAVLL